MAPRYQSPPTWPPPPPGWTPPPGWAPDPAWGPAPEGWQFWVEEQPARPNRGAWGWALLSSFGWWLLLILVLVVSSGGGFDAESAGATGLIEAWTLSCEIGGQVVEQVPVIVDRGKTAVVDLDVCGPKGPPKKPAPVKGGGTR